MAPSQIFIAELQREATRARLANQALDQARTPSAPVSLAAPASRA